MVSRVKHTASYSFTLGGELAGLAGNLGWIGIAGMYNLLSPISVITSRTHALSGLLFIDKYYISVERHHTITITAHRLFQVPTLLAYHGPSFRVAISI